MVHLSLSLRSKPPVCTGSGNHLPALVAKQLSAQAGFAAIPAATPLQTANVDGSGKESLPIAGQLNAAGWPTEAV